MTASLSAFIFIALISVPAAHGAPTPTLQPAKSSRQTLTSMGPSPVNSTSKLAANRFLSVHRPVRPARASEPASGAILADHNAAAAFSRIPQQWLDAAKRNLKMYYGHTSHGEQITAGMQDIASHLGTAYSVAIVQGSLPTKAGSFAIFDASTYDWTRDFYPTVAEVLKTNPQINVVMYMWCGQHATDNWQANLDIYLADMQSLEQAYPNVKFIYATGNAMEQDCTGCLRQQFNDQLRQFAIAHNKVLFDFGDLDAWYNGKQTTYSCPSWCDKYGCTPGRPLPAAAPAWGGSNYDNPCGHVLYPSCDNKAKAFWWLAARLTGWDGK
jgi:hypothetical protein